MLAIGFVEAEGLIYSTEVNTDVVQEVLLALNERTGIYPDQILIVADDTVIAHYHRGEDFYEENLTRTIEEDE